MLRELFLLPGYNYNYIDYSPANYLRNNFVDHGIPPGEPCGRALKHWLGSSIQERKASPKIGA